jgi:hypothetical protein
MKKLVIETGTEKSEINVGRYKDSLLLSDAECFELIYNNLEENQKYIQYFFEIKEIPLKKPRYRKWCCGTQYEIGKRIGILTIYYEEK